MTPVQAACPGYQSQPHLCTVQSLTAAVQHIGASPRLPLRSHSTTPSPSPSPSPSSSPSHCAPVYRRLTRLPQYHYSLASRSSTDILLPRKSSPLPNSTMAEREPRSIHMSRDWSNLPSDILDLCCSCMDMLSALRLAACSRARTQPSLKRGLSFSRHPACCYLVLRDLLTMIRRRT